MSPVDNARLPASKIPDAELVMVPRAGHAFPQCALRDVTKVLQIYEGANEIRRLVIARVPAKEPLWPECMPEEATTVTRPEAVGTLA